LLADYRECCAFSGQQKVLRIAHHLKPLYFADMNLRLMLLLFIVCACTSVATGQQAAINEETDRILATGEAGLSAVIDQPGPVIGCGQSVTLTATITGALEISWKRNGEFINGATTNTFVANQPGYYSVVAISLLCEVESPAVEVILESPLNAAITAPSGNTACAGDTVELQAAGGIAQWQWYRDGVALSESSGETYEATIPGNYVVVGNEGSPCASTSAPVTVNILPLPDVTLVWEGISSICPGDSLMIIAQLEPEEEIIWFYEELSVTSGNSAFFAAENGEYHALITNLATGCSAPTNSLFLQVLPGQEVIISDVEGTTFCDGQTASITLMSGAGDIQWLYNEEPILAATNSSLMVAQAGAYSVLVTGENGCESESNSITMEIIPLPNAAFIYEGNGFLCGSEDTLVLSLEEGNSYEWYADGVLIENENGEMLNVYQPGEYSVVVSNPFGCSAISQPLMVEEVPLPELTLEPSGSINLCDGQTLYFEAFSPNAIQYAWFLNGVLINDASSGYFEANEPGEYVVSIADNNGCEIVSEPSALQILSVQTPVITNGGITTEGQLLLTDDASGHQWYFNGESINGATEASYLATEDGVYSVIVIEDICESPISDGFSVVLGVVGDTASSLVLYPNPCSDFLILENTELPGALVSIYDLSGKLIWSEAVVQARHRMDISKLSTGMYRMITDTGYRASFSVLR